MHKSLLLIASIIYLLLPARYGERAAGVEPHVSACKDFRRLGSIPEWVSIEWISPQTSEDKVPLGKWCGTVGPALMHAPDKGFRKAQDGRVLVVNWNVNVGNGDIEGLVRDLQERERMSGKGDPEFVMLLEEGFRRGPDVPSHYPEGAIPARIAAPETDIAGIAKKLGWWMYYVPSMRNGEGSGVHAEDRGNAILSTLPLEEFRAIELPFSAQRRVALSAMVHDAGRKIKFRVAVMHLDTRAPLFSGSVFGAPAARRRQALAVANVVRSFPNDGLPLIVAGDLNTHWGPFESAVEVLSSVAPRVDCGPKRTHKSGLTLDHMFASFPPEDAPGSCQRLDDRFGSDHYPMVLPIR